MTSFVKDITAEGRVPLTAARKKEVSELLAAKHKEDSKLVKGIFKNLEAPGGIARFPYREYPQDPLRLYEFEDGKSYDIPFGLAKHINKTCNEKVHQYVVDVEGNKTIDLTKKRQRYQFLSTEFGAQ